MPVPISPATARLLTSEGREAALEEIGLPRLIAKLATLLAPDPTTPYAFGALRFLDVPTRRAAPLAQARIAQVLADLGFSHPRRIWDYLERHPRLVTVRSAPRLPKPPGTGGQPLGVTEIPSGPLADPISVRISRRATDRGATLAHELATAALGQARRETETLPGVVPSYVGTVKFSHHYPGENWGPEYLPTLFDRPEWLHIVDRERVLRSLDEWFPRLPMPPALPGSLATHPPGGG